MAPKVEERELDAVHKMAEEMFNNIDIDRDEIISKVTSYSSIFQLD